MLVITRKSNESFHLGEDIKVTILGNQGNYVKIGIDAPADILILRDELTQLQDNKKPCTSEPTVTTKPDYVEKSFATIMNLHEKEFKMSEALWFGNEDLKKCKIFRFRPLSVFKGLKALK